MIKQRNNLFSLIPFTALVNGEAYLVDDKERFETSLLNKLKYEQFLETRTEGQRINLDDIEVTLPPISYNVNELSPEQQERLDFINTLGKIALDEAKDHILNAIEPTSLEYVTYKLKVVDTGLNEQLLNVMETSASLYEENINLSTQNLGIMAALADLYETVMMEEV